MKKACWVLGLLALSSSMFFAGCHSGTTDVVAVANDTAKAIQPSKYLIEGKDTFQRAVDTFAVGDINGDGKVDTAYIIGPFYKDDHCKDTCLSNITFSSGIGELKLGNSLGGRLRPQADVNDDGRSEILFVPDWFSSCWSGLYVYSYKGTTWTKLGDASVYACADSVFEDRVKKAGKGYIEISDDKLDDDGSMQRKWRKLDLK